MKQRREAIILALAVVLGCCACTATDTSAYGMSLAETKSPVQLLRNESVLRLPSTQVASVESTDTSIACDGDDSIRSWESTATITLTEAASDDLELAMATLARSFEEDGWVVSPGNERESEEQAVLTSGTSAADIRLIAHEHTESSAATLTIEAAGPCVQTDGADSEEVRQLEGSAQSSR